MCVLIHASDLFTGRLLALLAASCRVKTSPYVTERGQICGMQIRLRSVNEMNHVDKTQRGCLSHLYLGGKKGSIMRMESFNI